MSTGPAVTGGEISGVMVLQAQDPLFAQIGAAFIEAYSREYAAANYSLQHYYSADTFNENQPSSSDPAFLRNYSVSARNRPTTETMMSDQRWLCDRRRQRSEL